MQKQNTRDETTLTKSTSNKAQSIPIQAQNMPNQAQNMPNQAQNMPNQAQNTINMEVSRFEVPRKEPVPFLKNLWQRAKDLVLKLKRTRWQLTCLRSITKRSFLPSATVKGLTQKGGSLCSVIQLLSKSSEIAWTTSQDAQELTNYCSKDTGLGN